MSVNSATPVKLLSLFRYPGGKTWLVPHVCQWLKGLNLTPTRFIEPFAGGGIVGLNIAVWNTLIYGDADHLIERIINFDLTLHSVNLELSRNPNNLEEQAFQTILRNRINHGGILNSGAGILKRGENGKGLKSRWYPITFRERIKEIMKLRECITFICGDGLEVIENNISDPDAVFFIDPPYTVGDGKQAGQRLYVHSELDHNHLFELARATRGNFLMTYENNEFTKRMAIDHGFEVCPITMRNTHHDTLTELIISRDLSWLASPE
jgi:DNA adenine methylase